MNRSHSSEQDWHWWLLSGALGLVPHLARPMVLLGMPAGALRLLGGLGLPALVGYLRPRQPWRWALGFAAGNAIGRNALMGLMGRIQSEEVAFPGRGIVTLGDFGTALVALGGAYLGCYLRRRRSGEASGGRRQGPVGRIVVWSVLVGTLTVAAGFYGSMYLPTGNLGPLVGLIVAGPIGFLAGALGGAVSSARNADKNETRVIVGALACVWTISLLLTFLMMALAPVFALPAIGIQALVVCASAFVLYRADARARLPDGLRRCRPIFVATLLLILLMTLFPPVIRPWWGQVEAQPETETIASLPRVAFVLDRRFDASRKVPLFAVHKGVLCLEWVIAAMTGLSVCLARSRARGRPGADPGPPEAGEL